MARQPNPPRGASSRTSSAPEPARRVTAEDIGRAARIFAWIAIIEQLMRTRATRVLERHGPTYPEFIVLDYFTHRAGEAHTVTSIAAGMQQNQPAMTKTVKKLLRKGLLRAMANPADKRSRHLALTPKGAAAHGAAIQSLAPHFAGAFQELSPAEMDALFQYLDRVKTWLDVKARD